MLIACSEITVIYHWAQNETFRLSSYLHPTVTRWLPVFRDQHNEERTCKGLWWNMEVVAPASAVAGIMHARNGVKVVIAFCLSVSGACFSCSMVQRFRRSVNSISAILVLRPTQT